MNITDLLPSIGSFVKDHGIAIFLVIFFVVVIYPNQAQERKEWILQISKLQEALDPSKRPISKKQAMIILELATESYVQSIEISMSLDGYTANTATRPMGSDIPVNLDIGVGANYTFIFGQTYSFTPGMDGDEEIEKIYANFSRMNKKNALFVRSKAQMSFERALKNAGAATSGLREFKYAETSLGEIWEDAFHMHYSDFSKKLIESHVMQSQNSFEKEQFISFLSQAELPIPAELEKPEDYERPFQVIHNFKTSLRRDWKRSLTEDRRGTSIVDSIRTRYNNHAN